MGPLHVLVSKPVGFPGAALDELLPEPAEPTCLPLPPPPLQMPGHLHTARCRDAGSPPHSALGTLLPAVGRIPIKPVLPALTGSSTILPFPTPTTGELLEGWEHSSLLNSPESQHSASSTPTRRLLHRGREGLGRGREPKGELTACEEHYILKKKTVRRMKTGMRFNAGISDSSS